MRDDGFGNLISDAHHRIERGHRLLKDHGNARAAQLAHGVVIERGQIPRGRAVICEEDFAGDSGLRRQQAHDGQGSDRLAGAGFADQAQDFAGSDGETEVADGRNGLCGDSRPSQAQAVAAARRAAGFSCAGNCDVQIAGLRAEAARLHGSSAGKNSRPAGDGQPRAAVPT